MKSPILSVFLCCLSIQIIAQAGSKNFIDQNYIEVIGFAKKEINPNEIYLKIIINERDNKGKESLELLETKMLIKLRELGIDIEEQLVVKDLGSNFKVSFLTKNQIRSSKEFELKVSTAAKAAEIIQQLESIGISNMSIDKIYHSKIDSFSVEIRSEAVKNAKIKAEAMSKAIDRTTGKVLFIQEIDIEEQETMLIRGQAPVVRIRGLSSLYGNRTSTLNIDFEKIRLTAQVMVRFALD